MALVLEKTVEMVDYMEEAVAVVLVVKAKTVVQVEMVEMEWFM